MIGFILLNITCYTTIPLFVQRSGATLLNVSNVTTVVWSMMSDIFLFKGLFYPLYVLAFILEIIGIVIYSKQ